MDTKITRLRNLMTPMVNYLAMKSADTNGQTISLILLDRELKQASTNMAEIRQILLQIPDDAIKE